MSQCEPQDSWAATTPPWPDAVVEARDEKGPRAVFQIQANGIRFDAAQPYEPSLASMHADTGPTVRDCLLAHDDHQWLWDLHADLLGPTATMEYDAVPAIRPDL